MSDDDTGFLELELSMFNTPIFKFRLAVDDLKVKWAFFGLILTGGLTYIATHIKELLL